MLPDSDRVVPMRDVSKMPPSNIDAEIEVLGGLMFDEYAYGRIEDRLHPALFSLDSHIRICEAIISLKSTGASSDLVNVVSRLSDEGVLERVGGKGAILKIFDSCITAVNIDQHVDLLVDKFVRRKTLEMGQKLRMAAYSPDDIAPELDAIADSLGELSAAGAGGGDLESCADILLRVVPEIEARQENPNAMIGVRSGLYDLDAMLQGLQRGALITVAGRPAMGKSALAMQIAQHVAHELPVTVFSLEMSKEDIVYRALSFESGVPMTAIRSGRMSQDELGSTTSAAANVSENCWVSETPTTSVTEMNALARSVKIRSGNRLGLIVVDYLQLMGGKSDENRNQEISKISRQLKIMARTLDVPVVALSQLSRSVESRTNKRPMLSDLRDSGAIEQDSDQVIFLYRDEYYNEDSVDRGLAELIIAKNRHGPTGTVKVLFEPHLTRFRNLARR